MSKKDLNFWESASENKRTYQMYLDMITELSISMFDWQGLPPSVNIRYMELMLMQKGKCVFFREDDMPLTEQHFLALPFNSNGMLDLYGIPEDRMAYGLNGYTRQLTPQDSVIIWNNYLYTPSINTIQLFAKRLADLDRTIDVNSKAQKTPTFIQCPEEMRLTFKNIYMQYDGNSPVIYGDKSINPTAIKVFKTDAPYVADKIYQLKVQYWNELLTYLGISNINVTKKERLITDEVTRNQGGVLANRYSRLCMRQEACRQINAMFGLQVSVEFRDDLRATDLIEEIEGKDYNL